MPLAKDARERFVAPHGKPGNAGTRESPWDLASALAGERDIAPGDIVWVRGGEYGGKLEARLRGREDAPVHVRAYPGERAAILDTSLWVLEPAEWLWIWDLEIAGTLPPEKRETKETGSHPTDLPGSDGLAIRGGKGCKYINLYIHDNVKGGVGFWSTATDSELHGCIIRDNGWRAPDRGHGHAIYTQNREGVKVISSCILSVPHDGSYTMHAYGSSRAWVDDFLIEDNVAYRKGPFLIGGGRPSRGIRVLRNYLHGVDLRLGYGAENEDCEVRDNVVARGIVRIDRFREVVDEKNMRELPDRKVVLIPNRYDPRRAHLVVYNGAGASEVPARVSPFLEAGDRFRLLDPDDLRGKPVLEGRCDGEEVTVPAEGEFRVLVVTREPRRE